MMRITIAAVIVLTACTPVDRGRCLQSHIRPAWMQMMPMTSCSGNPLRCRSQIVPIYHPERRICDQWEFPEGKPKGVAA